MNERDINWYRCPLPKETMQALNKRSDFLGFLQAGGHMGLLLLTGSAAFYTQQHGMYLAMIGCILLHGMCASFYINGVHELVHGTVFKSQWLNWFFVHLMSFLGWINHYAFWASHTEHHKYTLNTPDDLEVVLPTKHSKAGFIKSGIFNPWAIKWTITGTIKKCLGKFEGEWEIKTCNDAKTRRRVVVWARCVLTGHLLIAVVSFSYGFWIIPILVSCSHLICSLPHQLCNSTQHSGLVDNVSDFRLSCRTVILNPLFRFLYWHMNYHIEHHMYAAVPCYRLGKLHKLIKHELPPCKSLIAAWKEIFEIQERQQIEPTYQYHQPLPTVAPVDGLTPLTPKAPSTLESTSPTPEPGAVLKIWECSVCGFIYDEAKGLPKEGIAAGTRWQSIPDDWSCPDCGIAKEDFEMLEMQLAS